jgi:3,4-dihydroxy-2-butanone 4-phosphate synthase
MARLPQVAAFADRVGYPVVAVADLVAHRRGER